MLFKSDITSFFISLSYFYTFIINGICLKGDVDPYDDPITIERFAQFYCFKEKTCTPGGDRVCGFDKKNSVLAEFEDLCILYRANCNRKGLFIAIKEYICAGQKLYDAQNSVRSQYAMEWEHVPRLNITAARKKG
ncbi:unnamed protein product [Leptidea sinapis]|uniref:Uncharacterized protein n=1 Tax=Leptidea sinapis TaxID=189913 RepID=A0A5E4QA23_9NEOP|nr:unnamed protein product [Leptidea sinapis]